MRVGRLAGRLGWGQPRLGHAIDASRTERERGASPHAVYTVIARLSRSFVRWLRPYLSRLHHKTTKRLHAHLRRKFRLYAQWWQWKYHRHANVFLVACFVFMAFIVVLASIKPALASSIVPVQGNATSNNTGADINFNTNGGNVMIDNWSRQMSGYAWSTDLGWVDFGNDANNPQGPVVADKNGNLSGEAKVVNDGSFINFDSSVGSNVKVASGAFSGYAWSDDIGFIDFNAVTSPLYNPDITPPPTNASGLLMYRSNGADSISSNGWTNGPTPYFTWTAGADEPGGSAIKGYCLYLGQDSTGNPITTKGDLGTSPLSTSGACQFAVSTASLDTALSGYLGTALTSSSSPYYLNVVAIDNANNVYNGSPAQFQFRFDNNAPTNPAYVSAPSQFVSSKQVTLTWPTSGGDAASDNLSGVAGLQYRIGSGGTWYGDSHSGTQDCTDLLANDGSYTTQSSPDYANLQEGNNTVYFRTFDNACNVTSAYVTTVIKLNTTAPSSPQNLTATPSTNTVNSFAFSWLLPASYSGSASNITYCYTVNTLPTSNNCTFTAAGVTSLSAGAYATQPGDNTMYVVAKDEAGNINYATYASVTFTANTPAPGIPLNLDIADISTKSTSNWKLALSWDTPSTVGAGIANYRVYRSTNNISFSSIASTAGTSYVDSGLSQQTYYYKVKACDSANNCGAFTSVVSMYPTGKFTSPAILVSGPNAAVTTRSATVTWATDRDSSSQVEYGLSSGNYFSTAASNMTQTSSHSITLNNLDAGTTYYYRALWTDGDGNTGTSSEGKFTTLPAPTISNVSVTGINLHNATIQFTVKGATAVKLYYGPYGSLGNTQTLNTSTATSTYSIPLSGLTDGTSYTYRLDPVDVSGNQYTNTTDFAFSTPAAPAITNVQFQPVPGALTGTEQVSWTTNVPTTSQISYAKQGAAATAATEAIDTTLTKDHTMTVSNLNYKTTYWLVASGTDALGNSATSDQQIFHTGLDTRPPRVSNVVIQPSIKGTGFDAHGQIIVSWKTDKPGTSQIAYGQGSGGGYNAKTAEDTGQVLNHVVVISDLSPSHVYHLQVLSRDEAGNVGKSGDQTTIIGQATDSIINIIFNALQGIFGGL